jgi:hypothetical protein
MKQQTAVEWLKEQLTPSISLQQKYIDEIFEQAKEMDKEQIGYSKEDVLTAGEMGEINTYDTKHIVSYLDEAKQFNETYGGEK